MGELEFTAACWQLHQIVLAAAVAVSQMTLLAAAAPAMGLGSCRTQCGDVSVPFPFGLSPGCHLPGFDLTCDTTHAPPRLLIGGTLQVTDISLDNSTVRVLGPGIHTQMVARVRLPEVLGSWGVGPWGLPGGGPYVLSESRNVFLLSGCDLLAELLLPGGDGSSSRAISSCGSVCNEGMPADDVPSSSSQTAAGGGGQRRRHWDKCSGIGCCKAPIPVGCDSYHVSVERTVRGFFTNETAAGAASSDNYSVLIAEDGAGFFSPEDEKTRIPVVLAWAVVVASDALQGPSSDQTRDGNATCPQDLRYCHSSFSSCTRVTHPNCDHATGYTCKCWQGYQGNPYLHDGCQDIDECALPDKCYGHCINLPGTYTCSCPHGTRGNPTIPNGCAKLHTACTEAKMDIAALLLQREGSMQTRSFPTHPFCSGNLSSPFVRTEGFNPQCRLYHGV